MKNQNFLHRLRFALNGMRLAFVDEASFRAQAAGGVVAFAALFILRPAPVWWAMVGLVSAAVLAAELINTSLEAVIDRLHPEVHPEIAKAKDCAAAAVLVLSLAAIVVAIAMIWQSVFTA